MCLHGTLCSIPFDLIFNMTTFRKKNVMTFDPTPGVGLCVKTEYMLACCCICHSLKSDMQHDHVLKILNFDLWTPPPGSMNIIFATMFAACVIPFNLICNMPVF